MSYRTVCLFLSIYVVCCLSNQRPIALIGSVLKDNRTIENCTILIIDGRISALGVGISIPNDSRILDTKGVILPGLIDLHNHMTWNIFPRWKPIEEFSNRYDWQSKLTYQISMDGPHRALIKAGLGCVMQRYAEVKAITQGTTSVMGSLRQSCNRGLTRNIDDDQDLGRHIYDVFPLQMSESELIHAKDVLAVNGTLFIHLAEGSSRSAATAQEFAMLKSRGLLAQGVSLIHALALKVADFDQMAKSGVGLVWSPRSNIELYGETLDMKTVSKLGVMTALAPDWSPTGSDGLLSELNYASGLNAASDPPLFDDFSLINMATRNAAKLVRLENRLGSLENGFLADILVLVPKSIQLQDNSEWIATQAIPEDVALVLIEGEPVYGDPDMIEQLTSSNSFESFELCGTEKRILMPKTSDSLPTLNMTQQILQAALRRWGRTLGPLSECGS